MSKQLPPNPNLQYDKKQAKALLKAYQSGDAEAIQRVQLSHPRLQNLPDANIPISEFRLSDAQLVIAREYGFSSWPQLKHRIETIQAGLDQQFDQFVDAVRYNDTARVRKLLEETPALRKRINAPAFSFDTPAIISAVGCNNRELVDALLEYGADVNAKSTWWAGAFGTLHNTETEMVQYLIERGAQVDIFAAAQQNMIDVIRKLVEADPDLVHAKGPDGQRALHFARSREVIDYLLEKGADLHTRDIDHRATAAQWMIGDRPSLCRYLIDRGAEPDIFMVCALGDTDLVRNLLDANPDSVNKRIGQPDYLPVPLAPGLHIYVYTFGDNQSPHQIARQHGHQSVYELLLERSSVQRRFVAACERGDSSTAQSILRDEPKIAETLSYQDQRLLADAAWENDIEAVRVMLEAGFNPHVRGADASTPLDRAAFHGFNDLVKLLLKYNPPLTLQNQYGGRPLDSAIYGSVHSWRQEGNFPATAEALIEAGSKVNPTAVPSGNEAVDAVLRRYLNENS